MMKLTLPRLLVAFAALTVALPFSAAPAAAQQPEPTIDEIRVNYSLYYEDFKNENYQVAAPYLNWILDNAPGFPNDTDKNFERAVTLYDALATRADEAGDADLAAAYRDTVLMIYDRAVPDLEAVGATVDPYEWKLNKGRYIQGNPAAFGDRQSEAGAIYLELYEMDPTRLDDYYLNYLIADLVQQGDTEAAVEFMDELEAEFPERTAVQDYVATIRNSLFKSPEDRMGFLEGQLAKKPGDEEIMSELFDIYRELRERDKMYQLADQLLESTPTAQTYRIVAKMRIEDGQPAEAFELYEQALAMPNADPKVQDYYNMALAQQQMGSLSKARTYFRKALEVDPNFGPALVGIGDLYVEAIANCGSFEPADKAVYWLAVDYYERARSADSSVASTAGQKISTYRKYFPTSEEKFFKGWNAGDRFQINSGCYGWIGESTTVR